MNNRKVQSIFLHVHNTQIKIQKFQILLLASWFIAFQLLFFRTVLVYPSTMICGASPVNEVLICILFFHAQFLHLAKLQHVFVCLFYQQFIAQCMGGSIVLNIFYWFSSLSSTQKFSKNDLDLSWWKYWITLSLMLIPEEPPKITSIWWWFTTDQLFFEIIHLTNSIFIYVAVCQNQWSEKGL